MRKRLIPVVILGCLAFGPGAAEAATLTEYQAVIEGNGDWQRHDTAGGGAGSYERQAKFSWKTTLPSVLFYGKELRQTSPTKTPVVSPTTLVLDAGARALGDGPFDAHVEMPHEAIGMGKIIELLEGTESGRRCPKWTNASVSCTLLWKATVTFTRTRQQELETPPPPREPDVVTEPDSEPPPRVPETKLDDLLMPMKGKLSASSATVTIACPAGCSGTATALPLRGAKPLARKRFAAPAGRPKRVTLRFGARARRAIRRSGAVRVVVRAGGERARLTLRRR